MFPHPSIRISAPVHPQVAVFGPDPANTKAPEAELPTHSAVPPFLHPDGIDLTPLRDQDERVHFFAPVLPMGRKRPFPSRICTSSDPLKHCIFFAMGKAAADKSNLRFIDSAFS